MEPAEPVITPHPKPAELPSELRQKLQKMERLGPWEWGLIAALAVALLGTLISALRGRGLAFRVDLPAGLIFAGFALVILLIWFAYDRAKRAHIYQFETIAEVLHRHFRTEQALRDPLTGAYNRAALEELSERFLSRAERASQALALAVLDLDYFHELNANYGHIAGDLALSEFTHILHNSTRGSDVVARYGGDEFVLLLPETSVNGAETVVKRAASRLHLRNQQLAEGQVPFAFTAGFGGYRKGMSFSELFREADIELLRRKAARGSRGAARED